MERIFYSWIILGVCGISFCDDLRTEVLMVTGMFRHGSRTPEEEQMKIFPKYRHINNSFHPYGVGRLTYIGKEEMWNLGTKLGEIYKPLLFSNLAPDMSEIKMESTKYTRSLVSAELVMAGLNERNKRDKNYMINRIDWDEEDLKSFYLNSTKEQLLKNYYNKNGCKLYLMELTASLTNKANMGRYSTCLPFLKRVQKLGAKDMTPLNVWQMYEVFKAQENANVRLPAWVTKKFSRMEKCINEFLQLAFETDNLKKYSGGIYVDMVLKLFDSVVKNTIDVDEPRLQLFSGHDTTVAPAVAALGGSQGYLKDGTDFVVDLPKYGATILVELHRERKGKKNAKINRKHFVKILYWNGDINSKPTYLTVKGCKDTMCPLNTYTNLVKKVRIGPDELKACQSKSTPQLPNHTSNS